VKATKHITKCLISPLTNLLTNSMEQSPWRSVIQLVQKSHAFRARQRFISWSRCIQSKNSHPISLRSILILSFHLYWCLSSGPSIHVYRPKLSIHFLSLPCVLHAQHILLYFAITFPIRPLCTPWSLEFSLVLRFILMSEQHKARCVYFLITVNNFLGLCGVRNNVRMFNCMSTKEFPHPVF
jgi:hypothetical protein